MTSLEDYNRAVSEGSTIGHQWKKNKMKITTIYTLKEVLDITREATVDRELVQSDLPKLSQDDELMSAVKLSNGNIIVCVAYCSFWGTDVTPPDPIAVRFYLIQET
jgi:SepF-like predicted cell division protein (DUF552 family)